jgi:malonyl CoA-acyl carrier protein transacylase
VNAPNFCVVAGEVKAIESPEAVAAAKRIFASRLAASHAVHTAMMQPIEAALAEQFAGLKTAVSMPDKRGACRPQKRRTLHRASRRSQPLARTAEF